MEPNSLPTNPSEGGCQETQALSRLQEFFRLLGKREHGSDTCDGGSTSSVPIAVQGVSLQIPALNLRSDEELNHHDDDRGQAEAHATENLARPLVVTAGHSSSSEHLLLLSEVLACNLKDCFHILLEARLRAYANFLARHGLSLATTNGLNQRELDAGLLDVERKLHALSRLGASVSVCNLSTEFSLLRNNTVELDVVIQLSMPSLPDGEDKVLTLKTCSVGSVIATFQAETSLVSSVRLTLNTHQLLHGLVDAATQVSSCCIAHLKDTPTQEIEGDTLGQNVKELAGSNVAEGILPRSSLAFDALPIVSPEFGPRSHSAGPRSHSAGHSKATNTGVSMPFLSLKREFDVTVDELSTEKCELIVDQAIGSVDDEILQPPQAKKQKA